MRPSAGISEEMTKSNLPQPVGERHLSGEIVCLPGVDFLLQR